MKKIFVLVALFCFLSLVNATMFEEPFSKADFSDRMNLAVNHNKQQVSILISSGYFDGPAVPGITPGGTSEEKQKEVIDQLNRLESLKEDAIKEYNIFFDAYYKADLSTVQKQNIKLKAIFDEMNPLMHTIVKFEGIYTNVLYWTIKLEYMIQKGQINPDSPPIDNSKPITATIDKGSITTVVDDCFISDPNSACCKEKIKVDCCISDPNSDCCKEKPSPDNLLIPIAVALAIIVFAIVYVAFIKKN